MSRSVISARLLSGDLLGCRLRVQSRKSRHVRAMSVSASSGADFVQVFLTRCRSDEFDDPDLRFRVCFDVTLRGPKVRVPGQHLDVAERPANSRDLPRGISDESATPGVT